MYSARLTHWRSEGVTSVVKIGFVSWCRISIDIVPSPPWMKCSYTNYIQLHCCASDYYYLISNEIKVLISLYLTLSKWWAYNSGANITAKTWAQFKLILRKLMLSLGLDIKLMAQLSLIEFCFFKNSIYCTTCSCRMPECHLIHSLNTIYDGESHMIQLTSD